MITRDKLLAMLEMQDALNCKVHPQWRAQGFRWTRAIMVEAVEALDHYGWKWWKKQEPDLAQVKIELIDIWHFMLSYKLENLDGDAETAASSWAKAARSGPTAYLVETDTRKLFELMIASAAVGQVHRDAFFALMVKCGLTWDELYTTYVAKNVLNMFRQEHGYKEGTYIKSWSGMEDNVALEHLMKLKPDATPAQLRTKLDSVYATVMAAAA